MDVVLEWADEFILDKAYAYLLPHPPIPAALSMLKANTTSSYPAVYSAASALHNAIAPAASSLARDSLLRQCISLYMIALIGSTIMYFTFCSLSYFCFFDRRLEHHPRFLKNQIAREIKSSLIAMPTIDFLTLPWFIGEVRGKSMMYDNVSDFGWGYWLLSIGLYLFFNDFTIYWIHRLEHHPRIYKYIHKPHHQWLVPTPWAALAFHPLDGYAQSLPYHIFVYICPMHKWTYLFLFVMVQLWTIFIHDGDMITGSWWEKWINSPAHHTLHHLYFTCNYGQYFTWADEYYDSYRAPEDDLDPIHAAIEVMKKKGLADADGNPIKQQQKKKKDQ